MPNRGDRRYLSNRASKRRICETRDVCGGMTFHWHTEIEPRWEDRTLAKAKSQHLLSDCGARKKLLDGYRPKWRKRQELRRDFSDGD